MRPCIPEYNLAESNAIKQSASNGWLLKWKINNTWLKSPGYLGRYLWDSYGEIIASSIAKDLGIQTHVKYQPAILNIDGTKVLGCRSQNFIPANTIEVTIHKLILLGYINNQQYKNHSGYTQLLKELKLKLGINLQSQLEDIILLDSIILNTDRNLWNISILIDRQGKAYKCPIYDSGNCLGLASYNTGEFYEDYMYTNGFKVQPFNVYYEEQLKYIRNTRNYKFTNNNTRKTLKLIEENFLNTNNTYNITNTLTEEQLYFIQNTITKRHRTVIENKLWRKN